ncbi:MBL fold metallo-hydrolase [Peloplasma aerotolerans]|uniref:MBL fold metallo-hydrolase n=1 Tax=Peloplasma aerotolerans TaxID=3044389 RepID=A0AAW6U963_9MOLU|nr:MBL fold metallo-hydrolase [Mariniplasma sp. M4Ah]MDI6452658.1 MBL fold metallo-hydrolase [Mariniplasma sp. M4Ah]
MEIFVLASGSKGNMTYLKVGDIKLFIDAGISYKKIKDKMTVYQENMYDVKSLLITHEHHDHTNGLKMLLKQSFIEDVYLTKGTYDALSVDVVCLFQNTHIITVDIPFSISDILVTPFMLSHDAAEPVGFVVQHDDKKVVVLTDSGYVDQSYYQLLSNASLYILEANHHPTKLMHSPRPFLLKKRILSELGHLSNDDAAWLMNLFVKDGVSKWVVAHISEDCNTIFDIEESIIKAFDDPTKIEVFYATQEGLPGIKI